VILLHVLPVAVVAPTPALREMQSLKASEFASLEHAIEHYLTLVGVAPKRGALAVWPLVTLMVMVVWI